MRWRVIWVTLAVLAVVWLDLAEATGGKKVRRKIRRKVLKAAEPVEDQQEEQLEQEVEGEEAVVLQGGDRNGRGFLDQYYQQFDTRVQPSIEQSEVSNIQIPDEVYGLQRAYTSSASSSQDTLSSPSVSQGSASSSSSSSSSSSPAVTTPYLNPINIPHFTQEISYPIAEERLESVLPSIGQQQQLSSSASTNTNKRTFIAGAAGSSGYGPVTSPISYSTHQDNYIDDDSTQYATKPLTSKYFGLATTTTQDIQLGLTFTVPFLSIPLSGLTNLFNGGGLGDLLNFNFDSSNLIPIIVIALGAIFVLPQVIYWLTGVNLSAFNWGRSDDPTYLTELADTVDRALSDYDINIRKCLAATMCGQLQSKKAKTEEEYSTIDTLAYGLMKSASKTAAVKGFLGEQQVNEIMTVSESSYKCADIFPTDTCPWDPKTSKKIIAKLIMDSDLDLGTLANLAMQGAKAFA